VVVVMKLFPADQNPEGNDVRTRIRRAEVGQSATTQGKASRLRKMPAKDETR
jgi:hypothetical protein